MERSFGSQLISLSLTSFGYVSVPFFFPFIYWLSVPSSSSLYVCIYIHTRRYVHFYTRFITYISTNTLKDSFVHTPYLIMFLVYKRENESLQGFFFAQIFKCECYAKFEQFFSSYCDLWSIIAGVTCITIILGLIYTWTNWEIWQVIFLNEVLKNKYVMIDVFFVNNMYYKSLGLPLR